MKQVNDESTKRSKTRRIDWNENETNYQQELRWMIEFSKKPFLERFAYLCKMQMMGVGKQEKSEIEQTEWELRRTPKSK